ncbi:MAG: hypothetical protein WAU53_18580 [Rhodoplanes sp.]
MSVMRRRPIARRLYRRATAAAVLDTSINMMKRLEKEGKLTPVRLGSRDVFYLVDQVAALAEDDAARGRKWVP